MVEAEKGKDAVESRAPPPVAGGETDAAPGMRIDAVAPDGSILDELRDDDLGLLSMPDPPARGACKLLPPLRSSSSSSSIEMPQRLRSSANSRW